MSSGSDEKTRGRWSFDIQEGTRFEGSALVVDKAGFVSAKNSRGIKHDNGKPAMALIPGEALVQLAKVLEYGAQKYSPNNWRKGLHYSRLYSATLRHLTAWNEGEDVDPETQLSHVSHAMCNLAFLLEFIKTRPDLDDRYKPDTINHDDSNITNNTGFNLKSSK